MDGLLDLVRAGRWKALPGDCIGKHIVIVMPAGGLALALGIPAEAVMGLVGPQFVGGAAAVVFLLAAEVAAATAVVSESALVYMARHRNLMISLGMLLLQAALSVLLIHAVDWIGIKSEMRGFAQAAAVAMGLMFALGIASIVKARLLAHLLGAPINIWRWALVWAVAIASIVGFGQPIYRNGRNWPLVCL